MTAIRPLLGIARYELLRVGRDRLTLFFLLGLPLLVMVIIGSTFGGTTSDLPIGIISSEQTNQTSELLARLDESPALTVTTYADRAELERDIRTGRRLGGIILEAPSPTDNTKLHVQLLTEPTSPAAASVRTTITGLLDRHQSQLVAATVTHTLGGSDFQTVLDPAATTPIDATRIERTPVGNGQGPPDSQYAYTVPSQLVLFVFVAALGAGAALVDLNRLGISRRLLAAPVPLATLVGGLTLARLALTLFQASLLIAVGAVVFEVDWGHPAGVAALVCIYSLVAVGAGLLIGSLARTSEQAMAIGVPLAMGMGMLGGTMWPLDLVGDTMRTIGHATPQAWVMDGWITLIFDRGTIGDLGAELAALTAFAVAVLGAGTFRLRRQLTH
ncbi:MAG: ABC transporter permease [Acidimicrobiales bacterium]